MVEKKTVEMLGKILAIQAEIEGMKITNAERLQNNEAPAYNEIHFEDRAEALRDIVGH